MAICPLSPTWSYVSTYLLDCYLVAGSLLGDSGGGRAGRNPRTFRLATLPAVLFFNDELNGQRMPPLPYKVIRAVRHSVSVAKFTQTAKVCHAEPPERARHFVRGFHQL